jgi:hypothetical protein
MVLFIYINIIIIKNYTVVILPSVLSLKYEGFFLIKKYLNILKHKT